MNCNEYWVCVCVWLCACVCSGLCLFLAHPDDSRIFFSARPLDYESIHKHPWSLLTPVVVEKWYPFCFSVLKSFFFSFFKKKKQGLDHDTYWNPKEIKIEKNQSFKIMLQLREPIIPGQKRATVPSFHLSTVQSFFKSAQGVLCPAPGCLTINKKKNKKQKLHPVMYSEQETGGQRKELPLVRWYGFTKDRFRIFYFCFVLFF